MLGSFPPFPLSMAAYASLGRRKEGIHDTSREKSCTRRRGRLATPHHQRVVAVQTNGAMALAVVATVMRVTIGKGKARVSHPVNDQNRYTLTERVLNKLGNRRDGHKGSVRVAR